VPGLGYAGEPAHARLRPAGVAPHRMVNRPGYFSPNTRMQPPQNPPVLALGTRMWPLLWLTTTEWAFGGAGMF